MCVCGTVEAAAAVAVAGQATAHPVMHLTRLQMIWAAVATAAKAAPVRRRRRLFAI